MSEQFDVIVIGTGPAASQVTSKCAGAGWNVAVIEEREPGGTCALRGCNPKKVLTNAAAITDAARRCSSRYLNASQVQIDWPALIRFKQEFTEPIPASTRKQLDAKGVTLLSGTARFTSPGTVAAEGRELRAPAIVLATGARPASLGIPGEDLVISSDEFLELESLPRRIIFIGGGYISVEFAFVAAHAGAEVTVLQRGEHLLKSFDPWLTERLAERCRSVGINVRCRVTARSVRREGDALSVTIGTSSGSETLTADLVVHGAGRVPNLDGLDLPAGDVDRNESGVVVDEFLRSRSNPRVWAAGDCAATGQPPLTPTANEQGRTIARNLLTGDTLHRPEYGPVPSVVFGIPPLARVGLAEAEARERCPGVEVRSNDISSWGSVRKLCESVGASKFLVDPETDQLLGVHLLGPDADVTINLFALAMKAGLTTREIKSVLFAFPTAASDIRSMLSSES